jgi:hypothetical protein
VEYLQLLLVPDHGTLPLSSYRGTLRLLLELRESADAIETDEPLLVVGIATRVAWSARADAWRSLLQRSTDRMASRPPRACVVDQQPGAPEAHQSNGPRRSVLLTDEIFALAARHPLITRPQLVCLLGISASRTARSLNQLMDRGWLQPVSHTDANHARTKSTATPELKRLALVELTETGRREAARRLLLPSGLVRRRHGLVPGERTGKRMLRHLEHTHGANAFFVELAALARSVTSRNREEALVEWRSAAACARGRFRPDGYGCYRRGSCRFGFFLEFDRGTERPTQYVAKLATYYRYLMSGTFQRDFLTVPTLLVVCTTGVAETSFAREAYLTAQRFGEAPLPTFLTTTQRIRADAKGALGPIWRAPSLDVNVEDRQRAHWLPSFPHAPPSVAAHLSLSVDAFFSGRSDARRLTRTQGS